MGIPELIQHNQGERVFSLIMLFVRHGGISHFS